MREPDEQGVWPNPNKLVKHGEIFFETALRFGRFCRFKTLVTGFLKLSGNVVSRAKPRELTIAGVLNHFVPLSKLMAEKSSSGIIDGDAGSPL